VIALVVRAQMQKRYTGQEGLPGEKGDAITDIHEDGRVFVQGEYWQAFSNQKVEKGKKIRVVKVEGLRLKIEEM